MNTHSSTCARRPFAPEFLSNQLQTISEQRHFSEQPEDVVSLNTDPENLAPGGAKGHGFPPAGRPPGDEPPIDNNDSDALSINTHPDADQIVKNCSSISPNQQQLQILVLVPRFPSLRFTMAWIKLITIHSSFNVC